MGNKGTKNMWDKKTTNSKTAELSPTFQNGYKSIFFKKDN